MINFLDELARVVGWTIITMLGIALVVFVLLLIIVGVMSIPHILSVVFGGFYV